MDGTALAVQQPAEARTCAGAQAADRDAAIVGLAQPGIDGLVVEVLDVDAGTDQHHRGPVFAAEQFAFVGERRVASMPMPLEERTLSPSVEARRHVLGFVAQHAVGDAQGLDCRGKGSIEKFGTRKKTRERFFFESGLDMRLFPVLFHTLRLVYRKTAFHLRHSCEMRRRVQCTQACFVQFMHRIVSRLRSRSRHGTQTDKLEERDAVFCRQMTRCAVMRSVDPFATFAGRLNEKRAPRFQGARHASPGPSWSGETASCHS